MLNHSCNFGINITWLDALTFEFIARLNSLTGIFRFLVRTCVHALDWPVTFLLVPVRCLLSRLWQPFEVTWVGHSYILWESERCGRHFSPVFGRAERWGRLDPQFSLWNVFLLTDLTALAASGLLKFSVWGSLLISWIFLEICSFHLNCRFFGRILFSTSSCNLGTCRVCSRVSTYIPDAGHWCRLSSLDWPRETLVGWTGPFKTPTLWLLVTVSVICLFPFSLFPAFTLILFVL